MTRAIRSAIGAVLLVSFSLTSIGCDDNTVEAEPTLSGSWFGTTTVQGATFTVDLQMTENSGNVNANGTIVFVDPIAVNATGTYNFPTVSMTIRSSGLADLNFNGTLSADGNSLTGSMRGSGFDNFSVTLRR